MCSRIDCSPWDRRFIAVNLAGRGALHCPMPIALKLTHDEPRLVYLALVYHLGRPGSELDPVTKMPGEHGLRAVKVVLGRDLDADSAVIELDDQQYSKLLSAILGSVTELRGHHLTGGPSTVERFTDTAESLFPAMKGDPEEALAVAEAMFMLHRRMQRAVSRATAATQHPYGDSSSAPPAAEKKRWPFGSRGADR